MHMNETKNSNFWWPKLTTVEEAAECAKLGAILAALCALATTVLAISAIAGHSFLGTTPWSLADAAIFCVLAYGISRKSKAAALLAPMFYASERIYGWSHSGIPSTYGGLLALFFLLAFINSARGVLAFHRFSKESDNVEQVA
jgi:hypothetical protein